MKYLYSWLQEYIKEPLPSAQEIAERVNIQAFELEGVEEVSSDVVLDFDVKPNRTHDAWSHLGMAQEIATLFDLTFKKPESLYTSYENISSNNMLSVSVEKPTLAPRLMKRMIVDISVGPSPEWLKQKLEALGQRSINNIVDITNFVMLETGQPVHTFDYDKLAGDEPKKIILRSAQKGERITTLDGKEYTLGEGMLVWADKEKALDVAGIKGGTVSGIDENTKRIMLSACTFNPVSIRKTSRALGLLTDASKRFEQGLTPEFPAQAIERASSLLEQLAGGKVSHDVIDIYSRKRNPYLIGVSVSEVNKLLGSRLNKGDIESILSRLQFPYCIVDPIKEIVIIAHELVGKPYTYGASVSYDAPNTFDCSSFTAYVYAHAGVGLPRMTVDQYVFGSPIEKNDLQPGDIVFSRNDKGTMRPEFVRVNDGVQTSNEAIKYESKEFLPGTKVPEGISHNGIYIGDGKIIHASAPWHKGQVVIENLTESEAFKNIIGYRRILHDTEERYIVTVPPERLDLIATGFLTNGNKEDLIEEIGRVYGYDSIVAQQLPKTIEFQVNKNFYYTNKIRDTLVALGFSEVYTYSLTEKGEVELANPLASDKAFLRQTVAEGIKKSLEQGVYYKDLLGVETIKVFEIGTVFDVKGEHLELGITAEKPGDVLHAFNCIVNDPIFTSGKPPLKSSKKSLLGFTSDFSILDEADLDIEFNSDLTIGTANLSTYIKDLVEPTSYDDLEAIDTKGKAFQPISQYPFVLRDIALWTPSSVTGLRVEKVIRETAGDLLVRVTQFDEYKKDDRVSYAFHLVFQSHDKTLSDEEVNAIMEQITTTLNSREDWQVR